jgi:predicted nucleic acid-binding protein
MPKLISNTSCLIVLDNIDLLFILKELYGSIIITQEVSGEFGKTVPGWIDVREVKDKKYLRLMENFVDLGEASIITLSLEIDDNIVILDDFKARKLAKKLNINITGTLGIIINAKKKNIISSTKEVLYKLRDKGFRISKELENELLKYDM